VVEAHFFDTPADLLGDAVGAVDVRVGKHQGELLPTIASGDVPAATGVVVQDCGDHPQHLVPGLTAEGVVVSLEKINIEYDQPEGSPLTDMPQIFLLDAGIEDAPQRAGTRTPGAGGRS
jgi:hypothetical protein